MDGEAFPLFAEGLSFVFKSEVRLLRSHDLQEGCARMNALRGSSVGIELPLVSACTAWEHHPEEPVIMKVLPVNASPFLGGGMPCSCGHGVRSAAVPNGSIAFRSHCDTDDERMSVPREGAGPVRLSQNLVNRLASSA